MSSTGESLNKKLLKATKVGNLKKVKDLLGKGADVHTINHIGYTPLHHAAMYGHTEVVGFLLGEGADINMAIIGGEYISFPKYAPLHCAAEYGRTSVVELLLDRGANKNMAVTNRKLTPLHLAIESTIIKDESNRSSVVRLLLNKGAEINSRNNEGKTPLFYAAWLGRIEIVEFLLNKAANVHIASNKGVTSLDIAREMRFNSETPLRSTGCINYDNVIKLLEKRYNMSSIPNNENQSYIVEPTIEEGRENKKIKEVFSAIAVIFCCGRNTKINNGSPGSLLNDCQQASYGSCLDR